MSAAIKVENLGKRYRISHETKTRGGGYRTLRESMTDLAAAPFRRLRSALGAASRTAGSGHHAAPSTQHSALASAEDFWALKDVSFEVQPGEVVGIIGRNGAGKSTLLKILSRITKPTSGQVTLTGRVASLLEVGTGFHPELTGRENVYLNGSILGMSRSDVSRRFDEMVAFAEIEKFLDTPVKRYSSGMYTRLAFAVAAHLEPQILVVDEVLAVGDTQFQKKCLGKMGDIAKQGRTVLFVSHNMTAVSTLCNDAVWLDEGQMVVRGEVRPTVAAYLREGTKSRMTQVWTDPMKAPGNDQVRLQRVRVFAPGADRDEPITVETPVVVEFEYLNNAHGARLNLSAFLHNVHGECIFNTFSKSDRTPAGSVVSRFRIPGKLLNDGTYYVSVLIVKDEAAILADASYAVTFEVADASRDSAWHGKWPGAVRPRLDWSTDVIGAAAPDDWEVPTTIAQ